MVVVSSGADGLENLERTLKDNGRSCRYATELLAIQEVLTAMIVGSSPARQTILHVISDMLAKNPQGRPDIEAVQKVLQGLEH
jgi:hypothetical protein